MNCYISQNVALGKFNVKLDPVTQSTANFFFTEAYSSALKDQISYGQ